MQTFTSIDTKIIHDGFENDTFQAFIWDFYLSLGDEEEGISIEQIYSIIFTNSDIYRDFLRYCHENNFCFIEQEKNENYKTMMFLLAFEQARTFIQDWINTDIQEILALSSNRLKLGYANANIPNTDITFMTWLLRSTYKKIPVNSYGELTYFISEESWLYKVYSFETGIHYVDTSGRVTDLGQKNNKDRQQILTEIQELEDLLRLIQQTDFSNDESLRFLEWRNEYLSDTWKSWKWEALDMMHFRLWVWEQIREHKLIFEEVKHEDPRNPVFQVVWGKDVGDGDGDCTSQAKVINNIQQIRIIQ